MGTALAAAFDTDTALDFETLVRRHQAMVFSIALHFLHDRPAAEELAQDVFMQLHRHLSAMQSAEHVTFWLRRVTTHRCIDYSRRRRFNFLRLDAVPEPAAPISTPAGCAAGRCARSCASSRRRRAWPSSSGISNI
jgi:RNA polymerase sigma-70 factor (ECF subfamily)